MTMTVTEIREHAEQLRGRLQEERRKVGDGTYSGHPHANLVLIEALEGRVAELLSMADRVEADQLTALAREAARPPLVTA